MKGIKRRTVPAVPLVSPAPASISSNPFVEVKLRHRVRLWKDDIASVMRRRKNNLMIMKEEKENIGERNLPET
jgi:hypothetical protein